MAADSLAPLVQMRASDPQTFAANAVQSTAGIRGAPGGPVGSDPSADPMAQLVSMRQQLQPLGGSLSSGPSLGGSGLLSTPNTGPVQSPSQTSAPSGQASSLLANARSWLGVPYVYGGTSRSGVDCSGFTQQVYQSLGMNIGRDTSAQFRSGHPVGVDGNWQASVGQLRPGDLIFYGQPGASGPNAHVVMYVGNGQVMQAPHSGTTVSTAPLFSAASSDEPFLGVRRYL